MKIWLDLRLLQSGEHYSTFIALLLQQILTSETWHRYMLYLSDTNRAKFSDSIHRKYIKSEPWSLMEQLTFSRTLSKDKNDLMIFFSEEKPLTYRWDYILFIANLKEIHYGSKGTGVAKFFDNMFLNNSLQKAKKIICFESNTQLELNEKLNIPEHKIEILYPFFSKNKISKIPTIWSVKSKYSIAWDFFIYSWGNGNQKNLSRLIEVFKKLEHKYKNITLVILDQKVTEDIAIRKEIVHSNIVSKILCIGNTTIEEKKDFYDNAIGTIFPSLYESFPFALTEPISYGSPILASSIPQVREIMWDEISYFSPMSSNDMVEAIENFIEFGKQESDYTNVFIKYNPESTVKQLLEIINNI